MRSEGVFACHRDLLPEDEVLLSRLSAAKTLSDSSQSAVTRGLIISILTFCLHFDNACAYYCCGRCVKAKYQ